MNLQVSTRSGTVHRTTLNLDGWVEIYRLGFRAFSSPCVGQLCYYISRCIAYCSCPSGSRGFVPYNSRDRETTTHRCALAWFQDYGLIRHFDSYFLKLIFSGTLSKNWTRFV
jgi:hypothetical protein